MESYYCYEMAATGYSGALLDDKGHWVRKLPGKLLHNIISHGVARIAEFLTSESPTSSRKARPVSSCGSEARRRSSMSCG